MVASAINKSSVSHLSDPLAHWIAAMGVRGDEQADRRVHGGEVKAVYAYPFEHYPFWQESLLREQNISKQLEFGTFGENLTTQGLCETGVFVGDQWQIGDALLEVTKFREPCFKFNIKLGWSGAAKAMVQSNTSGWYLSVLREGSVKASDEIQVIPGPRKLSILQQSTLYYNKQSQADMWA
jgi:MOSC domain-containing protein YiiM